MPTQSFHIRTRPRMYLAIFIASGAAALLIEAFIALTDDFRTYADQQLMSATQIALQTEVAQMARGRRD